MLDVNHYPLPKVSNLCTALLGSIHLSKNDINRAYQQMVMSVIKTIPDVKYTERITCY